MTHAPMAFADFRSDTVTVPGPAMREAMARAEVGDDVFGEDPTVRALEEEGARILGKEAALFLPSGTMANQVAVGLWTRHGDEVLLHEGCHVYRFETGALAAVNGVQVRTLPGPGGVVPVELYEREVRPTFEAYPRTSLVVLENTHNWEGGAVLPLAHIDAVRAFAARRGLKVHLDGARLMNASVASGIPCDRLAASADSVTLCLSKGLGAPAGTLLAADREAIRHARRLRKRMGGGMRQTGILAAAGLMALRDGPAALAVDHARARRLFEGVRRLRGLKATEPETNMVILTLEGRNPDDVVAELDRRGIRVLGFGPGRLRFVTHRDLVDADVDRVVDALCELFPS